VKIIRIATAVIIGTGLLAGLALFLGA